MNQSSRFTFRPKLSSLKAKGLVKSAYTLAFALLLASGILVALPPTSTLAAACSANCGQGETISIAGASTCSCTDNSGCTWTINGHNYSSSCGTIPVSGHMALEEVCPSCTE